MWRFFFISLLIWFYVFRLVAEFVHFYSFLWGRVLYTHCADDKISGSTIHLYLFIFKWFFISSTLCSFVFYVCIVWFKLMHAPQKKSCQWRFVFAFFCLDRNKFFKPISIIIKIPTIFETLKKIGTKKNININHKLVWARVCVGFSIDLIKNSIIHLFIPTDVDIHFLFCFIWTPTPLNLSEWKKNRLDCIKKNREREQNVIGMWMNEWIRANDSRRKNSYWLTIQHEFEWITQLSKMQQCFAGFFFFRKFSAKEENTMALENSFYGEEKKIPKYSLPKCNKYFKLKDFTCWNAHFHWCMKSWSELTSQQCNKFNGNATHTHTQKRES